MKNGLSSADIKKRITFLVAGTLLLAFAAIGITNWHLYRLALHQEGVILTYLAKSQAQAIESFVRHGKEDARLLGQPDDIDDVLKKYQVMVSSFKAFGDTGSFVVVRREVDTIRWLIRHRNNSQGFPEKIPFDITLKSEPIRLALEGKSGIIIGSDYRGVMVLAAHEPIPSLNLGVVVKLDLAEIEAPFIHHGIESFLAALILVLGGSLIYLRTVAPMMPRLMAREETLRSILENASEGIITIDAAANILYANSAVERMFDYPAKELAGKPFAMLMSECKFSIPTMEEAMECTMLRRNGARFPVIISGRPWAEGTRRASTLIVQDISERKEADELLRASEKKFKGLADNALVGVIQSTLDGKIIYANNALLKIFEFDSLEEFISAGALQRWKNPEDRKEMVEKLKSSGRASFEAEMLAKTGEPITILYSAVVSDDTISATVSDISDRKKAEAELKRLNRVLLTVSNCNQALVRATDEQQLMDDVCRVLTETGGYRMAWIGLAEHDAEKTVKPAASSGHNEGYVETLKITWADTEQGQSAIGSAIRTGEPVVVRKIASDAHFLSGGGGGNGSTETRLRINGGDSFDRG